MCFKHWKQVPGNIQKAVWATYRNGQCDDKNPSKEWHHAADAAIGYVALLEDHPMLTVAEAKAVEDFGYSAMVEARQQRARRQIGPRVR